MKTNHSAPEGLSTKQSAPLSVAPNTMLFPSSRAHELIEQFAAPLDLELTINQLVREKPARARFFENLHIGYCCGGGEKTLKQVCSERKLDADRVLDQLFEHEKNANVIAASDESLTATLERIKREHHPWLRHELPRLQALLSRVADKHGQACHELWDIQGAFEEMSAQISSRIERHETLLFPLCTHLIEQYKSLSPQNFGRSAHFTQWNLGHIIETSQSERAFLCEASDQIEGWTKSLKEAPNACTTLRVALAGLHDLDARLQQLFFDENILLQQTIKLDQAREQSAADFAPSWMR